MAGVIERYASAPPSWAAEPRRITSASGRTFEYLPYILPVDAIAFTQTSVSIVTSKSSKKQSSLAQLVAELLTGRIPLESMELDDVTVAGPRLWSCNNRRLCILKCYQEASRRLQVLLYGRVPAALHLLPYVQIRAFVQVERDPWTLRDISVDTPRCPGHKLSRQDWEAGQAVDFSSSQMRIAEATQTVTRGTQQKPFFCPGDFAKAILDYCILEDPSEGFLKWAASAGAGEVVLRPEAEEALHVLRGIVRAALQAAGGHSTEKTPLKQKRHPSTSSPSSSTRRRLDFESLQ